MVSEPSLPMKFWSSFLLSCLHCQLLLRNKKETRGRLSGRTRAWGSSIWVDWSGAIYRRKNFARMRLIQKRWSGWCDLQQPSCVYLVCSQKETREEEVIRALIACRHEVLTEPNRSAAYPLVHATRSGGGSSLPWKSIRASVPNQIGASIVPYLLNKHWPSLPLQEFRGYSLGCLHCYPGSCR